MNTTFLSRTPSLGHSLAVGGTVTVDHGKPSLVKRLHHACNRVAAAMQRRRVSRLHPSEINLARQPRL